MNGTFVSQSERYICVYKITARLSSALNFYSNVNLGHIALAQRAAPAPFQPRINAGSVEQVLARQFLHQNTVDKIIEASAVTQDGAELIRAQAMQH